LDNDKKKNTTIGRFIVDRKREAVYVWLKRERSKGWITYSIPHI